MKLIALDSQKHRAVRVNPADGADVGDHVHLCPVVTAEFADIAADMPILLTQDVESGEFFPVALLGFEAGENLFLNGNRWLAHHKPLRLQHAPFLASAGDKGLEMFIDLDSARVGGRGEPLFNADGSASPYLDYIGSILTELLAGEETTRGFVATILQLGLAEPVGLEAAGDFYTISRDALAALPDAAVLALHRSGDLELIHLMTASLIHLQALERLREARHNNEKQTAVNG